MTNSLSLYTIEDGLAELLEAREATLADIRLLETAGDKSDSNDLDECKHALAVIEKTLAEYLTLEVRKVDNYHRFLTAAKALIADIRQEEARITARRKRLEAASAWLRERALAAMAIIGKKRVDGAGGRYLLAKGNGGLAPLVVDGWDDEKRQWKTPETCVVPSMYLTATITMPTWLWEWTQQTIRKYVDGQELIDMGENVRVCHEPNNAKIRQHLANGAEIPGCRMGERGQHLEVK